MRDESNKYVGGFVIAVSDRKILQGVRDLLDLDHHMLRSMKIRSGEHLAAILTTAFLEVVPHAIDTAGEVDLVFRNLPITAFEILPPGRRAAAFEVKSMPGKFRSMESKIDRMRSRGEDPRGIGVNVVVESAEDILRDARPLIDRAERALAQKCSDLDSLNVFLVVHPFDRFAIEPTESPVIGGALPQLSLSTLDTLWVLWVPDHLTVWSSDHQSWTDLFFNTGSAENAPLLSVLQDAESDFLAGIDYTDGSPYLFGFADSSSTD